MIKRLLFCVLLLSFPLVGNPSSSDNLEFISCPVAVISNAKYFPTLLNAIKSSNKSIYACLYYISYFPSNPENPVNPVNPVKNSSLVFQILSALVDAKGRGVTVEVILDRGYEEADGGGDMSKKNVRAYSFLKQAGIPVFYDDIETLTHSKYIIIDEKMVISGSFNWSEKSMTSNREDGYLIQSEEIAKIKLEEFRNIPRFTPEPVKDAIPIPKEFIENKNMAPAMIWKGRNVLELYLLLQYRSYKENTDRIVLTKDDLMNYFYYDSKRNFKGRGVLHTFKIEILKQAEKFSFIKSYEHDEKNQQFVFNLYKQNKALEDSLYLSELYWTDGWYKRLQQKSKVCLLYLLDKTESGRMGRCIQQAIWDAAREYGIEHSNIAYGTKELQRFNLIDKYLYCGENSNTPNEYILNDFYVYSDFQKALDKLKSETDPAIFTASMEIADLVNDPNDLDVLRQIVDLGVKYGIGVLNETIKKIKPKSGNSPYRRLPYVLGIIRSKGEGKY